MHQESEHAHNQVEDDDDESADHSDDFHDQIAQKVSSARLILPTHILTYLYFTNSVSFPQISP